MADKSEVIDNIEQFAATELDEILHDAIQKACLYVERKAKENAPAGDGQLRSSITSNVEGTKGVVGSDVEYAPYVEIGTGIKAGIGSYHNEYAGTGRQTPWRYPYKDSFRWTSGMEQKPFLEPALDDSEDDIKSCFEGII